MIVIILFLILLDFLKDPVDIMYFQNPWRLWLGLCNTLTDLTLSQTEYYDPSLVLLDFNYDRILKEFQDSPKKERRYFHNLDPWFDKNEHYYYYDVNVQDFPFLFGLLERLPKVDYLHAKFAVMDDDYTLVPHRAETNWWLVYNYVIEEDPGSYLQTVHGKFYYDRPAKGILYDHGLKHSVHKKGTKRRTVLILSVSR